MLLLRSSISAFMTCLSFSNLDLTLCRFSRCSVISAMASVCFLRRVEAVASLCKAASSSSRRSLSSSASRLRFCSIWAQRRESEGIRESPHPFEIISPALMWRPQHGLTQRYFQHLKTIQERGGWVSCGGFMLWRLSFPACKMGTAHGYLSCGSSSSFLKSVGELFQFPGQIIALLLNLKASN